MECKIKIDSYTMVIKALEIIEAKGTNLSLKSQSEIMFVEHLKH